MGFKLEDLRNRRLKYKKKESEYHSPTGLDILSSYIRDQNKMLLEKIADDKNLSDEDRQIFLRTFWQPYYWIPQIKKDKDKNKNKK